MSTSIGHVGQIATEHKIVPVPQCMQEAPMPCTITCRSLSCDTRRSLQAGASCHTTHTLQASHMTCKVIMPACPCAARLDSCQMKIYLGCPAALWHLQSSPVAMNMTTYVSSQQLDKRRWPARARAGCRRSHTCCSLSSAASSTSGPRCPNTCTSKESATATRCASSSKAHLVWEIQKK